MARLEPWELPMTPRVEDVAEIRRLGARTSRARTSDQTAAAIFWSAPPLVPWSAAATEVARLRSLDVRQVKTHVAIVVEQARGMARRIAQRIAYPTPQALIRGDARSCIPSMRVDPEWEPLLYARGMRSEAPCEACAAAGAAAAALRALLGEDGLCLEAVYPGERGVVRRFQTLTEMLQECEDAQVWSGLHLRATAIESTQMGLRLTARTIVR